MKVICFSHYDVSLITFLGTYFNGEVRALTQLESTLPSASKRADPKGLSCFGRGYRKFYQPPNPTGSSHSLFNIDQA